ncbi:hypothetical protein BDQ12DRAFT_709042 [Crucibulum laeve]|uniref:C2H2-type domain-containing protein n=1 Tax=Crucibulum laeve TaxID=68775 RepID=A0A5C3MPS2_9AGAR|nr:hypothetical protein BDQ12DRAFT_709042 [Crucibulum laeve]
MFNSEFPADGTRRPSSPSPTLRPACFDEYPSPDAPVHIPLQVTTLQQLSNTFGIPLDILNAHITANTQQVLQEFITKAASTPRDGMASSSFAEGGSPNECSLSAFLSTDALDTPDMAAPLADINIRQLSLSFQAPSIGIDPAKIVSSSPILSPVLTLPGDYVKSPTLPIDLKSPIQVQYTFTPVIEVSPAASDKETAELVPVITIVSEIPHIDNLEFPVPQLQANAETSTSLDAGVSESVRADSVVVEMAELQIPQDKGLTTDEDEDDYDEDDRASDCFEYPFTPLLPSSQASASISAERGSAKSNATFVKIEETEFEWKSLLSPLKLPVAEPPLVAEEPTGTNDCAATEELPILEKILVAKKSPDVKKSPVVTKNPVVEKWSDGFARRAVRSRPVSYQEDADSEDEGSAFECSSSPNSSPLLDKLPIQKRARPSQSAARKFAVKRKRTMKEEPTVKKKTAPDKIPLSPELQMKIDEPPELRQLLEDGPTTDQTLIEDADVTLVKLSQVKVEEDPEPHVVDFGSPVLNAHRGITLKDLKAKAERYKMQNGGRDYDKTWLLSFAGKLSSKGARVNDYRCYVTGCQQTNKRRDHIVIHVGAHLGQRPFKCSRCPSRFLRMNECRRHELGHLGKKTHRCNLCEGTEVAFVRKDLLVRHMRRMHHIGLR